MSLYAPGSHWQAACARFTRAPRLRAGRPRHRRAPVPVAAAFGGAGHGDGDAGPGLGEVGDVVVFAGPRVRDAPLRADEGVDRVAVARPVAARGRAAERLVQGLEVEQRRPRDAVVEVDLDLVSAVRDVRVLGVEAPHGRPHAL